MFPVLKHLVLLSLAFLGRGASRGQHISMHGLCNIHGCRGRAPCPSFFNPLIHIIVLLTFTYPVSTHLNAKSFLANAYTFHSHDSKISLSLHSLLGYGTLSPIINLDTPFDK